MAERAKGIERVVLIDEPKERLVVNGREIKGERLVIQPETSGFIEVNHTPYRGYIAILKRMGLTVVNYVLVEDYLYGVVPKEMPPSWNAEALRAQSVLLPRKGAVNAGILRRVGVLGPLQRSVTEDVPHCGSSL